MNPMLPNTERRSLTSIARKQLPESEKEGVDIFFAFFPDFYVDFLCPFSFLGGSGKSLLFLSYPPNRDNHFFFNSHTPQ
jgi:hypothetical protein